MNSPMYPLTARRHLEQRFRVLWSALNEAFKKTPNAFLLGCGRDTMAYEVRRAIGTLYGKSELRWALNEAYERGWTDRIIEKGRPTRYTMKMVGGMSPREQMRNITGKADQSLAALTANGGILPPEQSAAFMRALQEPTNVMDPVGVPLTGLLPYDHAMTMSEEGKVHTLFGLRVITDPKVASLQLVAGDGGHRIAALAEEAQKKAQAALDAVLIMDDDHAIRVARAEIGDNWQFRITRNLARIPSCYEVKITRYQS